jgi:hypothetical protein
MRKEVRLFWGIFAVLSCLGACSLARADDHINIALGPSLNGSTNPKFGSLGYEKTFGHGSLIAQCTAIFTAPIPTGACSLVLSARVQTPDGWFTRVGVGPGFVTRTDDRLSSIPEINIRYAFGIDEGGWEVGLEGAHWSNASIWGGPNLGRDFAGFFLGIHL